MTWLCVSSDVTFLSLVRDGGQVDEVCADDVTVDTVTVTELQPHAATQGREHLCEHDLLVPDRLIAAALY